MSNHYHFCMECGKKTRFFRRDCDKYSTCQFCGNEEQHRIHSSKSKFIKDKQQNKNFIFIDYTRKDLDGKKLRKLQKKIKYSIKPVSVLILFIIGLYWGMSINCATDSMSPTLTCKNKIGIQSLWPQDKRNLNIGDIVIYSPTGPQRRDARLLGWTWPTDFLIHRIIGKNETGFIIQGDNNAYADNDIFGEIKFRQISAVVRQIK